MTPSKTSTKIRLACPQCQQNLELPGHAAEVCGQCGQSIPSFEGIPDFLGEQERRSADSEVEGFYERNPFPGYGQGDNAESLLDRCRESPFLDSLDQSLAVNAVVLDAGCGTGQLASFLALASASREVWAVDASRGPLRELGKFRAQEQIQNLFALRADLFALPFDAGSFDLVSSRGVIHHTPDPWGALQQLTRLVAPGGHLVLGWYESYGRLAHHGRQAVARVVGRPIDWLDPILRNPQLDETKRRAWIEDQYYHPLEQDLALPEVVRKVTDAGLQWVGTIPPAPSTGGLLSASMRPSSFGLWMRRLGWALRGIYEPDAGLVSLVARRPA